MTDHFPARMHDVTDETRAIVDLVLDYSRQRLLAVDTPLDKPLPPAELRRLTGRTIDADGIGARKAIGVFEHILAPSCISTDDPRYLSFIPSAPSKAAAAFDVVVSASALYGGSWLEGAGAVHAENEVLRWLADEFGLPQTAGGVFVQGGTLGNLSALVAAREAARARFDERTDERADERAGANDGADDGAGATDAAARGIRPDRWRVVCSAEAHSSIASAARVMDVEVVAVPVGSDGVLRGDAVRAALDEHGDSVFAVVATAGSTNFGIVDDIASVAEVARERGVWLHVDGAYGLAAILSDRTRSLFRGVELADSVIVDPHKWLFAPFDACALIYRDPAQARRAHTQHAEYLDTLTVTDDWSPSDYAVHLTRRPRGLPLWFSLATYGTDVYRAAITRTIDLAQRIADEIARRPGVSLVRRPQLGVVVFEREGWQAADYARWSSDLLERQHAFVTPSSHAGRTNVRFALLNPRTTFDDLTGILDTMF